MDAMQKYSTADEVEIPEGKVENICKQFLVHEDSGLAYKLQNEEIEGHLNSNRNRNQIVRSDCMQAKHIQEAEQAVYQQYRKQRQAQLDEQMAKELQLNLIEEDQKQMLEQQRIAEEDEKYAKAIAEKEKEKMRRRKLAREQAQIEKIKRERLQYYLDNNFEVTSTMNDDLDELDLSDFCMKPPDQLRGDQLTTFMAEQDEELARFLQIYENQKKSTMVKDKQELMENQDYEIARLIYEEERAKLRRIKEKRLQKQRSKHAARNQELIANHQEQLSQADSSSSSQQPVEYYIPDQRLYRLPNSNRSNVEQDDRQQYLMQQQNEELYDEPPIEQDLTADGQQFAGESAHDYSNQANCNDQYYQNENHSEETNLKQLIHDRQGSSSSSIDHRVASSQKKAEKLSKLEQQQLRYNPASQVVVEDAQYTLSTKQLGAQGGQVNLSFVNRALPPVPTNKLQKFHNIAMDIDPTYHKSKSRPDSSNEPTLNSSSASNEDVLDDVQINGLHFAQLARVEDGQLNEYDLVGEQAASHQTDPSAFGPNSPNYVLHNQQLNYVHPVQPVQGQKRAPTSSNQKKPKKDKQRDKCRQQ